MEWCTCSIDADRSMWIWMSMRKEAMMVVCPVPSKAHQAHRLWPTISLSERKIPKRYQIPCCGAVFRVMWWPGLWSHTELSSLYCIQKILPRILRSQSLEHSLAFLRERPCTVDEGIAVSFFKKYIYISSWDRCQESSTTRPGIAVMNLQTTLPGIAIRMLSSLTHRFLPDIAHVRFSSWIQNSNKLSLLCF